MSMQKCSRTAIGQFFFFSKQLLLVCSCFSILVVLFQHPHTNNKDACMCDRAARPLSAHSPMFLFTHCAATFVSDYRSGERATVSHGTHMALPYPPRCLEMRPRLRLLRRLLCVCTACVCVCGVCTEVCACCHRASYHGKRGFRTAADFLD